MTRRLRFDTPPTTPPLTILEEADRIAGGQRSDDYGPPLLNHQRIAAIWNILLGDTLTAPITPRKVCLMMIGLKLAREVHAAKRDNLIDIAGYVKICEACDEAEKTQRSADS